MAKLWQRSRKPGVELVEADLSSFPIDRPTVIFLPGLFTTHGKQDSILDGIKNIESLLRRGGEPTPRILAASYGSLSNLFNIASYNGKPDRACSAAAREMARAVLMPLVTDKGKPLPEAEAAKRLRNLTFVGYSAGSVFAQEMYNATLDMMTKAGWDEDRARHVLSETVLISMGVVSRPSREQDRFTTVYLIASNDIAVRLKNRIWHPISRLFSRHSGDLKVKKLSKCSLLVTARIERKFWEWQEEADGTKSKSMIQPLLPAKLKIYSNHEPAHYMTCDDEHNAFSRIVLHTLINALHRKGRPDVDALLEPAGYLRRDEKAYRQKISDGRTRAEDKNNRKNKKREKNVAQPAVRSRIYPASPYPPRG